MKLFANIVASVLHPAILILPAVFLIVYKSVNRYDLAFLWTVVSLVFTGFVAAFVLYGVKKGFFSDIDVSVKKQRVILYPFIIIVTLSFTGIVYLFNGPPILILACILFIVAMVVMDIINIKIKASAHVASIASIVTGIFYLYGGLTVFLYILIPLVAWARVVEKRHTLKETIVGAIIGVVLTAIAFFVVQSLI